MVRLERRGADIDVGFSGGKRLNGTGVLSQWYQFSACGYLETLLYEFEQICMSMFPISSLSTQPVSCIVG